MLTRFVRGELKRTVLSAGGFEGGGERGVGGWGLRAEEKAGMSREYTDADEDGGRWWNVGGGGWGKAGAGGGREVVEEVEMEGV